MVRTFCNMLLYVCIFAILLKYGECNEEIEKLEIYSNELPCFTYLGDCVMEKDCPSDRLTATKGLCPTQQKYGVECCYKHNDPVSKCYQRGGECYPKSTKCPDLLTVRGPGICSDDEICCILI